MDYTAIGDVTNAAARLESATRTVGTDILIGPETFRLIPPELRTGLGCAAEPRNIDLKGVGPMSVYPVDTE
jgi:class 3 adenylate cyclase